MLKLEYRQFQVLIRCALIRTVTATLTIVYHIVLFCLKNSRYQPPAVGAEQAGEPRP